MTTQRTAVPRRRCAVLVPFRGTITPECDAGLRELERRGYHVERCGTFSAIDQGRSQMATTALIQGFEEICWIDSDIAFDLESFEQLRELSLPIACGLYPVKGKRALACNVLPGTDRIKFGTAGGLLEVMYAGVGFMCTQRQVYEAMERKLELPTCNQMYGIPLVPYFLPTVVQASNGWRYLAEDYSFCHRARACGYRIIADTRIRLWHMGIARCGWEAIHAATETRFHDFTLEIEDSK